MTAKGNHEDADIVHRHALRAAAGDLPGCVCYAAKELATAVLTGSPIPPVEPEVAKLIIVHMNWQLRHAGRGGLAEFDEYLRVELGRLDTDYPG